MDRFNALGRGAQIMLVAGALLLISLFLPWQDFGGGELAEALGVDDRSGWYGFAGIVLGLLTIVTLAWLVVRLMAVDIPLPVSQAMTAALLGVLVAAFGIIKFLSILGDEQTIWAWIGVVLAIAVAVGAYLQVQEAGGIDTLKTEASSLQTSTQTTAPPPPAEATPPPPAAAEPPPPAPPVAEPPPPAAQPPPPPAAAPEPPDEPDEPRPA
jgi:uncharacterized membrane protein YhdT